jgi:cellulose synthase/poly-beta-1,6-N-acetylglucosamine synthase-like glycosyltransferase
MLPLLLVFVLFAVCAMQTFRMLLSWRYLRARRSVAVSPEQVSWKMYLLVPLAFEQEIVSDTFERFRAIVATREWLRVLFITTARETARQGRPTTRDIIEVLLAQRDEPRMRLLDAPLTEGVMAHQLNHGVNVITSEERGPFLIAVYNADSDPPPSAIEHAYTRLLEAPQRVLQQHAMYPSGDRSTLASRLLSHIAAWQTRWSLQFELGRLLLDHWFFPDPRDPSSPLNLLRPFHYTIGHGLFLSSETWQQATGLPEDEINEDAFFGLQLHTSGKRIEPVPALEIADPPPSLSAYLKQQSVWFNGPLYAFSYARRLLFGSSGRHAARPTAQGWLAKANVCVATFKLSLHALYWIAGPPLLLLCSVFVLVTSTVETAIAWLLLIFYFTYGLNILAALTTRAQLCNPFLPSGPISALIAYLLHCVGPMMCVARILTGTNTQRNKYKTARN